MNTQFSQWVLAAAEQLLDPRSVLSSVPAADTGSLSHGLAGTALLHARLSAVDPIFGEAAVNHWTAGAAFDLHHRPRVSGIFGGPGGLAASLVIGSHYLADPAANRAARTRAVRWLSAAACQTAARHRNGATAAADGPPWHIYDAISGLAGTGRVLLAALACGDHDAEPGLEASVRLLSTILRTRPGTRPGWWLAPSSHPPAVRVHPSGAATTGMAHGVAGPLAFLAAACLAGFSVPGQETAIRESAQWLLRWRDNDHWPPHVTGDELDTGTASPVPARRTAWCYGTPGISRALDLAARALGDTCIAAAAAAALESLALLPVGRWDAEGLGLCHGYAGVMQCTAARCAPAGEYAAARIKAALHHPGRTGPDGAGTADPGLLNGMAGTALALADYSGLPARRVPTPWDAVLLLS